MRGEYIHKASGLIMPNTITDEGEAAFLKMMMQDDQAIIAAGANWYFGLMEDSVSETKTLADITGEPTVTNGYARQAIVRDNVGWPTIGSSNGIGFMESADITFTAAGGDFSTSVWRLFLTDQAAGTVGTLFSIGSPLAAALLIADTESQVFNYRVYLR